MNLILLLQSCDDILEPKLEELINQVREIWSSSEDWLADQLTSRLSSLSSADDLFNFFTEMRGQGCDCLVCVFARRP